MEKNNIKFKYSFKKNYEAPVKELYPLNIYLPGRGIWKKITEHTYKEFEWYRQLEYYGEIFKQCAKCGTCRFTFRTWYPSCPSGELRGFESYYLGGKNLLLWGLTRGKMQWSKEIVEVFYHCTLCGHCQVNCQIPQIHHNAIEYLEAFREEAVRRGLGPMPSQRRYGQHTLKEHNPYMELHAHRLNWLLPDLRKTLAEKAEVIYFVGCTSSYRQTNIARATFNTLKYAGVDFTIMQDEWCCGSPLQRTGQREIAEKCAKHNLKEIDKMGANLVVTSCAGCYRTIADDYRNRYGLKYDFNVIHSVQFILSLLRKGKLKLKNKIRLRATYHDPCHIGRHMGIYEEPRELLKSIPGIELIEMRRIKENAWCCGAGGGVKAEAKDLAMFATTERLKEAKETGAQAIVSVCPFCYRNFKDGIEASKIDLKVYDIIELIEKSIVDSLESQQNFTQSNIIHKQQ